jgi:hypothetical protein
MKLLPALILAIWLLGGLYVGIAGITKVSSDEVLESIVQDRDKLQKDTINTTWNGQHVATLYDLKYLSEYTTLTNLFPWTQAIPKFTAYLITAMAFGLLGALIGLIKDLALTATVARDTKWFSRPLLGLLTGLVVLGLSYLLPTVLIKGNNEIRPLTLMFLCLFCGIFSEKFYHSLASSFDKLIKNK